MSVLKSLVDWEKLRRESKQSEDQKSIEEDSSAAESQVGSDVANNFEKVKAHKSTMEAAISEVLDTLSYGLTFEGKGLFF